MYHEYLVCYSYFKFRWQFFVQLALILLAASLFSGIFFWSFDDYYGFGLLIVLLPVFLFRKIKRIRINETGIVFEFILLRKKRVVLFKDIKSSRIFHTRIQHRAGTTDPVENFELKTKDGSVYFFSKSEYSNYNLLKHTIYKRMKIVKVAR